MIGKARQLQRRVHPSMSDARASQAPRGIPPLGGVKSALYCLTQFYPIIPAKARMIRLWERGYEADEIGKALQVSPKVVWRQIRSFVKSKMGEFWCKSLDEAYA